ncbi:MAG: hypothetical protein KIT31_21280 [Deltaproteobacteria bacterium]|nr:hypothetical protein [Deltaproteobacteria bacterium]
MTADLLPIAEVREGFRQILDSLVDEPQPLLPSWALLECRVDISRALSLVGAPPYDPTEAVRERELHEQRMQRSRRDAEFSRAWSHVTELIDSADPGERTWWTDRIRSWARGRR